METGPTRPLNGDVAGKAANERNNNATANGPYYSSNAEPLPSLKLRIKKEVKYISNADGSQVVYNDYTTSHSTLDEASNAQNHSSHLSHDTSLGPVNTSSILSETKC